MKQIFWKKPFNNVGLDPNINSMTIPNKKQVNQPDLLVTLTRRCHSSMCFKYVHEPQVRSSNHIFVLSNGWWTCQQSRQWYGIGVPMSSPGNLERPLSNQFWSVIMIPYGWWFRNPAITSWYREYPMFHRVFRENRWVFARFLPSTISSIPACHPPEPCRSCSPSIDYWVDHLSAKPGTSEQWLATDQRLLTVHTSEIPRPTTGWMVLKPCK